MRSINNIFQRILEVSLFSPVLFSACLLFPTDSIFVPKSPEVTAQKYGISYPIKELGGCVDFNDCKDSCADPVNQKACSTYAKTKGFYQEQPIQIPIPAAVSELGCSSEDSCKQFCDQQENFSKCSSFAQKYNLVNNSTVQNPSDIQVIQKAREILGCSTYNSCQSYCSKVDNQQKCSEFAKRFNLRGGILYRGPGGCTTNQTCTAYCSDPVNFKECTNFLKAVRSTGEPVGPVSSGHATRTVISSVAPLSEDAFTKFCRENPLKCSYNKFCLENTCRSKITNEIIQPTPVSPTNTPSPYPSSPNTSSETYHPTPTPTIYICPSPLGGCGGSNMYWDRISCACKYYVSASSNIFIAISTPTPIPFCSGGRYWNGNLCVCPSGQTWSNNTCQGSYSTSGVTSSIIIYSHPTPTVTPTTADPVTKCTALGCKWSSISGCICPPQVYGIATDTAKSIDLNYPVGELGNCNSCSECSTFCSKPANLDTCLNFAKKNNIIQNTVIPKLEAPEIISDTDNKKLFGAQIIQLKGKKDIAVEIYLQPADSEGEMVFVGRGVVKEDSGVIDFTLDTKNYPNGKYKLIAKSAKGSQTSNTVASSEITIDNLFVGESVKPNTNQIVFPSQFDPQAIPASVSTQVTKIENTTLDNQNLAITFQGTSLSNTIITILIYSSPIVVTVKTDANGLWQYNLEKPLEPGKHIAYIAVSSPNGSKIRSEVAQFSIASAIGSESESLILESAADATPYQSYTIYVIIIVGMGMAGLLAILWFKSSKSFSKLISDTINLINKFKSQDGI